MGRQRILVLTPRFPYPVIGGDRLRIYQVCRALSGRFDLTLLSLCETEAEMRMSLPADGVFARVERVLLGRGRSRLNALLALPRRIPLQVAYYHSHRFGQAVQELLPGHDAALAHMIRCAGYIRDAGIPRIVEMTDAISKGYGHVTDTKIRTDIRRLVYPVERKRLYRYEREICSDFDLTVLVSKADMSFLGMNESSSVIVCSNGVDVSRIPYSRRTSSGFTIAYIGNMHSMPNMDACLYFATEVLPGIMRRFSATFRVIGRIGRADAARLEALPGVEVTGTVTDINAAVAGASIGVCPVRMAAGIQNKVLEYMALGLPVIASRVSLGGFDARPGTDLLVADTPDEYADQAARIWTDTALADSLARNGRAHVEASHDWRTCLRPMVDRVGALLQERGR